MKNCIIYYGMHLIDSMVYNRWLCMLGCIPMIQVTSGIILWTSRYVQTSHPMNIIKIYMKTCVHIIIQPHVLCHCQLGLGLVTLCMLLYLVHLVYSQCYVHSSQDMCPCRL